MRDLDRRAVLRAGLAGGLAAGAGALGGRIRLLNAGGDTAFRMALVALGDGVFPLVAYAEGKNVYHEQSGIMGIIGYVT